MMSELVRSWTEFDVPPSVELCASAGAAKQADPASNMAVYFIATPSCRACVKEMLFHLKRDYAALQPGSIRPRTIRDPVDPAVPVGGSLPFGHMQRQKPSIAPLRTGGPEGRLDPSATTHYDEVLSATTALSRSRVCRAPCGALHLALTRHTVLPTSSATSSAPSRAICTPTGRPIALSPSRKPVSTSRG